MVSSSKDRHVKEYINKKKKPSFFVDRINEFATHESFLKLPLDLLIPIFSSCFTLNLTTIISIVSKVIEFQPTVSIGRLVNCFPISDFDKNHVLLSVKTGSNSDPSINNIYKKIEEVEKTVEEVKTNFSIFSEKIENDISEIESSVKKLSSEFDINSSSLYNVYNSNIRKIKIKKNGSETSNNKSYSQLSGVLDSSQQFISDGNISARRGGERRIIVNKKMNKRVKINSLIKWNEKNLNVRKIGNFEQEGAFKLIIKPAKPKNYNDNIIEAIKSGDVRSVKWYIYTNPDKVDMRYPGPVYWQTQWTPLLWAAYMGMKEICEVLLANGADINTRNSFNETPLFIACMCNHLDIVVLLIERGARIEVPNSDGFTPLIWATRNKNNQIVKLLLFSRADPNCQEYLRMTPPIITATRKNCRDVCSSLLIAGADIYLEDVFGNNPISSTKDVKILKDMLKYDHKNIYSDLKND